jgi:hypothetical protein
MKPGDRILYKPSSMENKWITVEVVQVGNVSVWVKPPNGAVKLIDKRHTKPIKEAAQ